MCNQYLDPKSVNVWLVFFPLLPTTLKFIIMTQNFTAFIDGIQYFICEYCIKEIVAKKRVEYLCELGKKAYYTHSNNDFIIYSSY